MASDGVRAETGERWGGSGVCEWSVSGVYRVGVTQITEVPREFSLWVNLDKDWVC